MHGTILNQKPIALQLDAITSFPFRFPFRFQVYYFIRYSKSRKKKRRKNQKIPINKIFIVRQLSFFFSGYKSINHKHKTFSLSLIDHL